MEHYAVKRLALVLAVQAEIEGMKATNLIAHQESGNIIYDELAFLNKSSELTNLAHAHDEQL